jgi:hypothetical protein
MAPKINFSSQFSSCSLGQINTRIKSAQCLVPYQAPDVAIEIPATSVGAVENTAFTLSFTAHAIGDDASNEVSAMATLPAILTLQSVSAPGGACTIDGASVSCSLGNLPAQETRKIDLIVVGAATGTGTATFAVASPNDYVSTDNTAQMSIEVSATPAPPTAPATSSTPGGGGSLDLEVLVMLGGIAGFAVARRWPRHRDERHG